MGVESIIVARIWFLFVVISVTDLGICRTLTSDPNPCDSTNPRELERLRTDQITVLINGYSESRIPLLQSIVASYSGSSIVSSILVLWGNPGTESGVLEQLYHNLTQYSLGTASISLIQQSTSSLNARFVPRSSVDTRGVLICDDDVEIDRKSLEFAFSVWKSNSDRLVGVFVRSHGFDLEGKEWIYTVHPDKYSIVLTKFMMMKQDYLFEYSCNRGVEMVEMRKIVDEMRNCEDILMNFVAADRVRAGSGKMQSTIEPQRCIAPKREPIRGLRLLTGSTSEGQAQDGVRLSESLAANNLTQDMSNLGLLPEKR